MISAMRGAFDLKRRVWIQSFSNSFPERYNTTMPMPNWLCSKVIAAPQEWHDSKKAISGEPVSVLSPNKMIEVYPAVFESPRHLSMLRTLAVGGR